MSRAVTEGIGEVGILDANGIRITPATNDSVAVGTTPAIYNLTMTLANTEYSQALPTGTRALTLHNRGLYATQFSYTNGASGTTFITIPAGMYYYEEQVNLTSKTVYAQCPTAAQVLEIIVYS
jgi:hypothetical protein